jgi:hypothetical protein
MSSTLLLHVLLVYWRSTDEVWRASTLHGINEVGCFMIGMVRFSSSWNNINLSARTMCNFLCRDDEPLTVGSLQLDNH